MKNSKKPKHWGDATIAIHAGEDRVRVGGPVGVSIARTANFTFESTEEMKLVGEGKSSAYIYTRHGNPTLAVAEEKIAALEGAEAAVVTASGSAAISSALLAMLKSGDEVIATRQLYGGSYVLMRDILPRYGIVIRYVDTDLRGIEGMVNPRTKALYVETPTNPALRLVDLRKAAAFAKEWALISIVDSTFASPALQKPLEVGFNMVVHSASKYLAGHSDVIAGVVAGSAGLIRQVRQSVVSLGGSMDPEAAFLLIRGLKTLDIRLERQCESAMKVAKFLAQHRKIAKVHYLGLPSHPDHRLARQQMRGFGGMLAFDMKGGLSAARRFCDRVEVFLLAASLGGVESLVVLPVFTSHSKMSTEELRSAGVAPGTIRMSVGIENAEDLIEDLRRALA